MAEQETKLNQEVEAEKFTKAAKDIVGSMEVPAPQMAVFSGRQKIYTDYINSDQITSGMNGYIVLNENNMHNALTQAMKVHTINAEEIKYLTEYAKNKQNILNREKSVRTDINNKVVINYAYSFTRDITGYTFGKPMQYILRNSGKNLKKELKLVADYAELADKFASDKEKATNSSIAGISHRGIFFNERYEEKDEAPFIYMDLDSQNTFVAYSSQVGNKEVFACTYFSGTDENKQKYTIYTVYTTDKIYQYRTQGASNIVQKENLVSGYPKDNPLGICIIENENNQFRMGHWETGITLMDAINKVASDSVNDIEQFVDAILVAVNAEIDSDTLNTVRTEHFAQITSPQGLNADLKYIQAQLDGASVEQTRQYLESCLRVVVGIPDRKSRAGGGGDTGDAVKLRDGWADMEIVARDTETFMKKSEKKELRIILNILRTVGLVEDIKMIDIDMKYPRNKTDNIMSKTQAMNNLWNMKMMAPEDVLEIGDITTDVSEVVARGEKYWKKKAEEGFEEQQKLLAQQGANGVTQEGDQNANKQSGKQSTEPTGQSKPGSASSGKQPGKQQSK